MMNCKWITYLSATSVYGDHKGDWVNEKASLKPTSLMGKADYKQKIIGKVYQIKIITHFKF